MLSGAQSKCGVRRRTELHERVSTKNRNKNPKGGEACVPQERREDGLTSTPLGRSHDGGREVGGGK